MWAGSWSDYSRRKLLRLPSLVHYWHELEADKPERWYLGFVPTALGIGSLSTLES